MRKDNKKRAVFYTSFIFGLMVLIMFGCSFPGSNNKTGKKKNFSGTEGTYVLQWSIMNMYKDDFEDWENTGDKVQRDKVFYLDGKGKGTFKTSSEGKARKITYDMPSATEITILDDDSIWETKNYHGTLSADGTMRIFDGDEDDDFTVEYCYVRQ